MMLLAVDVGNTGITLGIFDKNVIKDVLSLPSDKEMSSKKYSEEIESKLSKYDIDGCIIASVVEELSSIIKSAIDRLYGIDSILLTSDLKLGLNIITDNPKQAGADRIANAAAIKTLYGCPSIVVDFGTATTFDVVNSDGDFIGGIIMPGIKTQLKSLHDSTSKLPELEPSGISKVIGTDTYENIMSGVIRAQACAVEGLLKECASELGEEPIVVLTGGYSELMSEYLREYEVNKNLTLEGLKIIYNLNLKL